MRKIVLGLLISGALAGGVYGQDDDEHFIQTLTGNSGLYVDTSIRGEEVKVQRDTAPLLNRIDEALMTFTAGQTSVGEIGLRVDQMFSNWENSLPELSQEFVQTSIDDLPARLDGNLENGLAKSLIDLADRFADVYVEDLKASGNRVASQTPTDFIGIAGYSQGRLVRQFACVRGVLEAVFNTFPEATVSDGKLMNDSQNISELSLTDVECEEYNPGSIWRWDLDPLKRTLLLSVANMYHGKREPKIVDGRIQWEPTIEERFYHWDILVHTPGVQVGTLAFTQTQYRDAFEDSLNQGNGVVPDPFAQAGETVFPFLPRRMIDPINDQNTIWERGLIHRVYAEGFNVLPLHIYRSEKAVILSNPINTTDTEREIVEIGERLPDKHSLYQPTQDSCIDALFSGDRVPLKRSEFPQDQSGWCLGRCRIPVIANSS